MSLLRFLLIGSFVAASVSAEARVFNLGSESLATYLIFTGGSSNIGTSALDRESSATTYSDNVHTNLGGEFGFVYVAKWIGVRFAFEVLRPQRLQGISATSASGAALYTVDSDVLGYIPKIGAEITLYQKGDGRAYLMGDVGYANVTVKNSYTNVNIAPSAAFMSEMKGTGNSLQAGIGYEYHLFDNATVLFEGGYRSLVIDNFMYTKDVTTFQGAQQNGADVVDTSGLKRSMDFSGGFFSFGFRFWM